jgi:hypothetical protein
VALYRNKGGLMKILSLFPEWGAGIGVILLFSSISFAIIYIVVKRNFTLKSKYINISTFIKQFGYVIKESMKSAKKQCMNELAIRPMEQMDYVDDRINEIYDLTMSVHTEILQPKLNIDDVTNHPQNLHFSDMLENVLTDIKVEIKRRFKKLLIKYPAEEYRDFKVIELDFQNHKENVTNTIILQVSTEIKRRWVKNEYIQFSEMEKAMKPIMKDIENKVSSAFQNAIGVQYKIYNKNCLIDKEVDEIINKIEEQ